MHQHKPFNKLLSTSSLPGIMLSLLSTPTPWQVNSLLFNFSSFWNYYISCHRRWDEISHSPIVVLLWIPVRIRERHRLQALTQLPLCALNRNDKASTSPSTLTRANSCPAAPDWASVSASGLTARCSVWTWWSTQIRRTVVAGFPLKQYAIVGR